MEESRFSPMVHLFRLAHYLDYVSRYLIRGKQAQLCDCALSLGELPNFHHRYPMRCRAEAPAVQSLIIGTDRLCIHLE